ncbi:helix-turn-helix domain-containing protein [Lentibacillus sp. CBA3610]|uniref:winged helix-turn-helix transcriptional regulator n=1 Tax=Lentibacillus sp. CBA3610 TaxID=2518176 RepID=UPI001595568A|nr:helix-turn-helix domain-containing protein [Lentibacillus sp. CBA3610]QKY71033.1 transcriptional regulator [Lentibacillus sp. CBA3610]
MNTKVCPYIEASFDIIGKKWNGQIIHYLSLCQNKTAHFSDIKRDLSGITPRSLSIKLTELNESGLIDKNVTSDPSVVITYSLTQKGTDLANSLKPIQEWAKKHLNVEENISLESGDH